MTILPSRSITAGLNVPADSHPFPRGEMIGVSEIRRQAPNAGSVLFCEARATNKGRTPNQALLRIDLIMESLTAKPQSGAGKNRALRFFHPLTGRESSGIGPATWLRQWLRSGVS